MDGKETIAIITVIKMAYPYFHKDISAEERQYLYALWQECFQEIPYSIMSKAVSHYIANSKMAPSIAEIGEEINRIKEKAYLALDSHYRQQKWDENVRLYDYPPTKYGALLSEEELAETKELLRMIENRQLRINEGAWKQSQKKLGGKQ